MGCCSQHDSCLDLGKRMCRNVIILVRDLIGFLNTLEIALIFIVHAFAGYLSKEVGNRH